MRCTCIILYKGLKPIKNNTAKNPAPFHLGAGFFSYCTIKNQSYSSVPYHSSKSGVEKYLSAVSGRTVTTLFPGPKSSAIRIAAATLVPEEMPHIMPSLEASCLEVSIAS